MKTTKTKFRFKSFTITVEDIKKHFLRVLEFHAPANFPEGITYSKWFDDNIIDNDCEDFINKFAQSLSNNPVLKVMVIISIIDKVLVRA